MFSRSRKNDILKVFFIVVVGFALAAGIMLFSFPLSDAPAFAEDGGLSVSYEESVLASVWFGKTSFNPLSGVIYYVDDGNQQQPTYPSYTISLINKDGGQNYTGSGAAGSESGVGALTWNGASGNPKVAGEYTMKVTAGGQSVTADLELRAWVAVSQTEAITIAYDGEDKVASFNSWSLLKDYYSISQADGMPGALSNYQLKLEWGEFVTEIKNAGTYPIILTLTSSEGADYNYIDYQSNTYNITIKPRPLLVGPDIAIINKTKTYNGDTYANGSILKNGTDSTAYDYLLTETSYDTNSGFIQADFDAIRDTLATMPMVIFQGISKNAETYNSFFMDAGDNPSSTVSAYDAQGNIIYDKKIQVYYALNPALSELANYVIAVVEVVEQNASYALKPGYAEYIATECAILPGIFVVSVDTATKEYGTRLDSLQYQLIAAGGTAQPGNIAVTYSGDLLQETIGLRSEGPDGIRLSIKIGRLYREGIDSPSDVVFDGKNASNENVLLVEYTRYTPLFGNYYFYPEVSYDGDPVEPKNSKYACGSVNMNYVATLFTIKQKQLTTPAGLSVLQTKEYDGLKQALSFNTEFTGQWVVDQYYIGANLINDPDMQYIQSTILPIYDTAFAGTEKKISVSFVLSLTDLGIAENKGYLLSSYRTPDEVVYEDCTITQKRINFNFDMQNAIARPFDHAYFYPDENVLVFQKPFGAIMPTIKDLLFGDYVLDGNDQIIYEEVYETRPVTVVNEFGIENYLLDIYGNIVYEQYGTPTMQPKRTNYFLRGDDVGSVGLDWSQAIDLSYYCLEEYSDGTLKSIQITRYTIDPVSGAVTVTVVDGSTPGAVLRTIGQDTPPTGDNPGIRIELMGFSTDNYIFQPKSVDNSAYFRITKRAPIWEMAENQTIVYNGRQHSSMLEDVELTEPVEGNFATHEEYLVALQSYNLKRATFARLININLAQHENYLEIIGSGGLGINYNVTEYAPPGVADKMPIDAFDYAEDIRLMKYAGQYAIEVWLPETTSYMRSPVRMLYLNIEQVELNVYLSPSKKNYKEENPSYSPLYYKSDTTDAPTWGWRLYDDIFNQYYSTVIYRGFINNETPLNIGFGEFVHCAINYGEGESKITAESLPGKYSINAVGGVAHNYKFEYSTSFSTLEISKLKAVIEIINDDISVVYDPNKEAWEVDKYVEGVENPVAAYTYSADDNTVVEFAIAGYKPIAEAYDFTPHFVYLKDEGGNYVLDGVGEKIAIGFFPKVVRVGEEWVEYQEGMEGDILDCTPADDFQNAKLVGNYIMRLYARPAYFEEPDDRFISLTINFAETEVEITEGVVLHAFDGAPFDINGTPSDESDDNFTINNKEIVVQITVELSSIPFDGGPVYSTILELTTFNFQLEDTRILNAGYYRVTFYLSYDDGVHINYNVSQTEYILLVQVEKGQVTIKFATEEGVEEWYYRGTPYTILDQATAQSGDLGVIYSVRPAVPSNSVLFQIYKFEVDSEGNPIEVYPDGNDFYDSENNPIPLPERLRVPSAVNAGWYLFRIKASGSGTQNYDDSEWIQQKFLVKKANVSVYLRGKLIPNEEQENFPGLTRYPLSKIYGEENPKDNIEIYYSGWMLDEDPYSDIPANIPAGFTEAELEWNIINAETNARPETPYPLLASGASSDNYDFIYYSSSFYIYRKQAKILTNEDYTTSVYTGTEQQSLPTFRAPLAPNEYTDGIPPYAYALSYDPNGVDFTIVLIGRRNADNTVDTTIKDCIDVGTYVFSIAAAQSTNYTEIPPTEYLFIVTKSQLNAFVSDNEITYGDQYPAFGLSFSGFVGKDLDFQAPTYNIFSNGTFEKMSGTDLIEMLTPPTLVIPSNAINVVSGGYTIRLSGGSARNYWINVEDTANLNILKKSITVDKGETIIKTYDGNTDADDFVGTRNYVFTGIIKHYLKPSVDAVGLRFSATFDSPEVGSRRTVSMRELYIDNNNYRLLTEEFTCNGEITKVTPIITMLQKDFEYDGTPKQLTPIVKGLEDDEVNYTVKYKGVGSTAYSESQNPPTIAGIYEVTVTTDDPNYVVRNVSASMRILKAKVNIYFAGDISQDYGAVTGLTARAIGIGNYSSAVAIRYYNHDGKQIEDIKTANSGWYTARAIFNGSANFSGAEGIEEMQIKAKSVTVNFSAVPEYVYDGIMKRQTATFYNVVGQVQNTLIKYALLVNGEETFVNVDGEGNIIDSIAPKDVGTYIAYAVAPDGNYALSGELEASFTITKKHINIRVNDITVDQGYTPAYVYTVEGIAAGENAKILDVPPTIYHYNVETGQFVAGSPTAVGVYRIIPADASDNNYTISYTEGRLTVNSVQLVANTNLAGGLMLQGSFSPEASLNVRVVQNGVYSKAGNSFEVFKMNNEDYAKSGLGDIYEISLSEGSIIGNNTITIRMLLPAVLRGQEEYQIAHIKLDGSIEILSVTAEGEYLEFSVSELGNFSVVVEQDKGVSQVWIYVAIAGAVLVILLGIIIIKKKA